MSKAAKTQRGKKTRSSTSTSAVKKPNAKASKGVKTRDRQYIDSMNSSVGDLQSRLSSKKAKIIKLESQQKVGCPRFSKSEDC